MIPILCKLISENHVGFVRGRLIVRNVLLTQEIVDGKEHNKGGIIVTGSPGPSLLAVVDYNLQVVVKKILFSHHKWYNR